MTVLSDAKILAKIYSKELQITPCQVDNIQPSSIDLTLDQSIRIPKESVCVAPPYPTREEIETLFDSAVLDTEYTLHPGDFILAQIQETISLSDKMVGNIQNRNSLIRLGVDVGLSTYINPGYKGKLPIAIHNIGKFDVKLVPGMRICQLILTETHGVLSDYGKRETAKYHAEEKITLSRLSEDVEFAEYVSKTNGRANPTEIIAFLKERVEEKSRDFFSQLTPEQKKALGLG